MYQPLRAPRDQTVTLGGLEHHLTRWGPERGTPTVLLHGWMDAGATFQFLVDQLPAHWPLAALDWRGFGRSAWEPRGYWFQNYLADVDALLDHLSPNAPADVVGHSMGGNVACLYAGVHPERIRRLVNIEGLGLPRTSPGDAPDRYRQWLGQLRTEPGFATHPTFEQFADFLQERNPRLAPGQAAFIARAWATERTPGKIEIRADPRHKLVNPVLYRHDEVEACWRRISAPVMILLGELSEFRGRLGADASEEHLRGLFRDVRIETLTAGGHMLHHERPADVARLLEEFFA